MSDLFLSRVSAELRETCPRCGAASGECHAVDCTWRPQSEEEGTCPVCFSTAAEGHDALCECAHLSIAAMTTDERADPFGVDATCDARTGADGAEAVSAGGSMHEWMDGELSERDLDGLNAWQLAEQARWAKTPQILLASDLITPDEEDEEEAAPTYLAYLEQLSPEERERHLHEMELTFC